MDHSDRVARYLARRMNYVYIGQLRMRDRISLWNALCRLLGLRGIFPMYDEDPPDPVAVALPSQLLATHLRDVVRRLFVPLDDSPEEMNLTGSSWTEMPWQMPLQLLGEGPVAGFRRIGAVARQGPHTITLTMLWSPQNAPRPQVTQIRYTGPQRFHIVEPPGHSVDRFLEDSGLLREAHDIVMIRDPADISDLRAGANDTEVENLENWTCALCSDGIDDDKMLMAAHAAFVDAGGRHVLHVFHRRCLENLRRSQGPWSQLCPTCKQPLDARPLPNVWIRGDSELPQRTILHARLDPLSRPSTRNPYVLTCGTYRKIYFS